MTARVKVLQLSGASVITIANTYLGANLHFQQRADVGACPVISSDGQYIFDP